MGHVTSLAMARLEGLLLRDPEGREYIDFAGGIGVNHIGRRHPEMVAASMDAVHPGGLGGLSRPR